MEKVSSLLLIFVVGWAVSGCVSLSKYRTLQAQSDTYQESFAKDESKIAELNTSLDSLNAHLKELTKAQDDLRAQQEKELSQMKTTYDGLVGELKQEIEAGQIQITQIKNKLSVNVAEKIFFDSGRAEIKESGRKVLSRLGEILKKVTDQQIRIEGHTDNVPISGSLRDKYPTNWELSAARATNVARFLQEKAGVNPELLMAVGYGPYMPVAANDAAEGRARNRRIEIVLQDRELSRLVPAASTATPTSAPKP